MSRTSFRVNLHSIVCLNVKELLTWSRRHISSLRDSNVIQTHNHLAHKRTLNHLAKLACLAKWLSVCLQTKWLWVQITLLSQGMSVGWIRSGRSCLRVGGNCQKFLKRGWNWKEGRENKDFKRGASWVKGWVH